MSSSGEPTQQNSGLELSLVSQPPKWRIVAKAHNKVRTP